MLPKNKVARGALAVVALSLLASGLIYFFGVNKPKPAVSAAAASPPLTPLTPMAAPPAAAPVEEKTEKTPNKEENAGQYLNLPAGNLRRLTEMTAELQETKLAAEIGEQQARLNKLNEAAVQIVVAAPAAGSGAAGSGVAGPVSPPVPSAPKVVSVQGIDGRVTASVETASGLRTLQVGDAFGAGRVERINSAGVHTKGGQGTQLIGVEE